MKLTVIILSIFTITAVQSKRILGVFPVPSVSHQVVFRPLMIELAKRGHEVTVITPDPAFPKGKTPPNYTEIDVHDLSYPMWKQYLASRSSSQIKDLTDQAPSMYQKFAAVFEEQTKSSEVQALINNSSIKFDLLFTESVMRTSLGFAHLYKCPVIDFSSFGGQHGSYETIGAPTHPLLYPLPTSQRIYNLTLWEKIKELSIRFYVDYEYYRLEKHENERLRRIFKSDTLNLNELKSNVKMLFVNAHPIWDFNRPVPPSVVYLGGLHQNPLKELPQDLRSYLDSSKNGVIYVSFGTNMRPSLLPPDKLKIFTKVFSELPYDILWKWDVLNYPDCPKNVKIATWFPQSDLLRHPNIKLFITQAGLQSTDEAITAEVPVVGIPMLWDQWYNAEMYEIHKVGTKVILEDLTEEILRNAISTVLDNYESYHGNMVKLNHLMRDQQTLPLERAVWWTEHVLRTGGDHLRSPSHNISWADYYQLDVILFCLSVLVVISVLVTFAIRYFVLKFKNVHIKIKTK